MDCMIGRTAARGPLVALAVLALSTAAEAQQRATGRRPAAKPAPRPAVVDNRASGFMFGVYTVGAQGVTVSGADMDGSLTTGFGPGAGFMVGYGFNKTFSGFASVDVAKQNASGAITGSFGLRHMEIGGRANLPYGNEITVPYLTASIGRRAMGARVMDHTDEDETSFDMRLTGGMFGTGGGVQHAFSPTLAFDGGLEIGFGRFDHYDWDGNTGMHSVNGSTSVRLRAGVTWRPARRTS
jgi:hypothetical protein